MRPWRRLNKLWLIVLTLGSWAIRKAVNHLGLWVWTQRPLIRVYHFRARRIEFLFHSTPRCLLNIGNIEVVLHYVINLALCPLMRQWKVFTCHFIWRRKNLFFDRAHALCYGFRFDGALFTHSGRYGRSGGVFLVVSGKFVYCIAWRGKHKRTPDDYVKVLWHGWN